MWQGRVTAIHIAGEATEPMQSVAEVRAVSGRGLEGDRYFHKRGTYSNHPGSGREVTLIEEEAVEALAREAGIELPPGASRRNIMTRGVPLNHLVGRRLRVGEVLLEGTRLCEPCAHLEGLTRAGVLAGLVHRGGLRTIIVTGGIIRIDDLVRPAE
ncbi:MAG TPA: MOSC domain-containing protein [Candidatus Sulfotelmatobacter sp.]|nr:MOSC domain-containing protein [Candidatus Sulfotelmatobacter sp.]